MPTARLPIDAAHRAASSDAHAIGAVTGLTDALAGKAAVAHETALTGVHGIVANGTNSYGLGDSSVLAVNVGTGNVAFGFECLKAATSANYAVGIGYKALLRNTTGYGNIALGNVALGNNTTGHSSVAIGGYALGAQTSGNSNFAIGGDSLRWCSTGARNAAIGFSALNGITTTNNNIGIGASAGNFLADGVTSNQTSANCTYIGAYARASVASAANETVIGYTAIGGGSNTVRLGNSSVTAWLPGATNKVAIGSATLAFKEQYMTDGTNTWKLTVDATGPVWTSI